MQHPIPTKQTFSYLDTLNPKQKEAVEALDGPVLVLAGAGTGKTRVLTTRLAHIINSGKAWPSQILAVTFTNKAAQEMKERVSTLLGNQLTESWWMGTFHALAAKQLRRHAHLVRLESNFTILDTDDQIRLLKQIMLENNIDIKKWPPKSILHFIQRWKDRALPPERIPENETGDIANGKVLFLYRSYQQRLKAVNACDFGDLLLHMIEILKNPDFSEVLEEYKRRFKYILVDEYQDTNVAQYLWLRLLSQGAQNICCVGDDDQSIYGWRGADIGNILRFENDFKNAQIIRLEQNYRSTNTILKAAGAIIANNEGRLGKDLWSDSGDGHKITIKGLWDGEAEARWITEEIKNLQSKNEKLSEIAILVRAGFQTREFEERFIQLGLPYQVIGGPRFYERKEVRDALAYLRVTAQPADDLALERIINLPKRGIGNVTLQTLHAYARARSTSLFEAIEEITQTDELRGKAKATLLQLIENFQKWRSLIDTMDQGELTALILDESGYMDMWKMEKSPDASGRVENLKELITGMSPYESLTQFLEHVSLVMDNQENNETESITLMTLHGAKGLEFDHVFLPGWEEGLFPSQRTMDENGLKGLEEERRLAYVGITRARKRAFISYAANRQLYGKWINAIPSRFVNEIPESLVSIKADTGLYKGRSAHWDSNGSNIKTPRSPSERKVINEEGITFSRGDRIFHDKFGYGVILNIDGHKLDINFEKSGKKRVMDSFVTKH